MFKNLKGEPALFSQLLVVAVSVAVFLVFIDNYQTNLAALKIQTGFDFLSSSSGFAISQTLIDYSETSSYFRVYLIGLLNTLLVTVLSIVFATVIGLMIALARLSKNWLLRKIGYGYIELFRNIPPLLHILFWYQVFFLRILPSDKNAIAVSEHIYLSIRGLTLPAPDWHPGGKWFVGLGLAIMILLIAALSVYGNNQIKRGIYKKNWIKQLAVVLVFAAILYFFPPFDWIYPKVGRFGFDSGMTFTPELIAIVMALSTYTAVYIGEAIRASIEAVPKGQSESAQSLGLSRPQYMRLVILPQAMRTVIPPVISQYLNILKNSSLGVVIAYPDLVSVFSGTALNQSGRALEIISMTMFTYLAISLGISFLLNSYNRYLQKRGGA